VVDAVTVANRLLELAKEDGTALTPMQLLKLVYIAHGWMLSIHHRPLISNEIQAWQYGPVIPQLYNTVRSFKSHPVEGPIGTPGSERLDPEENDIVEQVFRLYGHMTGPALSRITHASGTPWAVTYRPGEFGTEIPNDIIADHYERLKRERMSAA
jgi:uncharacterized phage-associated protein